MKRKMKFGLALFFTVFVAPVWAHHAAEGIVSDEVWEAIDDNLAVVGSPHLDIDFDDVMGSMAVGPCLDDPDDMCMVSYYEIDTDDEDVYEAAIELLLTEMADPQSPINQVPTGQTMQDRAPFLDYEIVDLVTNDGISTVYIYEPVGTGVSDVGSEPPKSGTRSGG